MSESSFAVRALYGTAPGRAVLKLVMKTHADRLAVAFLRSSLSRPVVGWYARRNDIPLDEEERKRFRSFQDFFGRTRDQIQIDREPGHLISPCDGWLSAYPIREDSSFSIKGSDYRLGDLFQDEELARTFQGGDCLIFRLCPSDYHHYCYIDDGFQGENHFIPGELHSVQPAACERYPVYTINRRSWARIDTDHFGPVVQTEIGALVVGGIVNEQENVRVVRGMEKGRFELAGSTITLMFQKDRIRLQSHIAGHLAEGGEYRVMQGMWIGEAYREGLFYADRP